MGKYIQKICILWVGLTVAFVGLVQAGPVIVEGQVSTSGVWSGEILVKGNAQIMQGVTVSVQGGTQVKFEPGANLYVQGTLVANGNLQSAPIYFMPATQGQAWGAIYFYGAPANCLLSGCYVTGAGVGVYCLSSSPTITGSYIYGNQYGVFAGEGGAPNIQSSYIMQNAAGVVAQGSTAGLNIQACVIQKNTYGVYAAQFASINITGCSIKGNQYHIVNGHTIAVEATGNTWDDGVPYAQYKDKLHGQVNTGEVAAAPEIAAIPEEEAPVEGEEAPPEEPVITFEKRSVGGAFVRGLVPGLGQFYNGRMVKGIIVPVGFVMNLGISVFALTKSNSLYEEYGEVGKDLFEDDKMTIRKPDTTDEDIKDAKKEAIELYDQQDMYLMWWKIGRLTTLGWYFYGVFDSISDAMVQPVEKPRSVGVTAGIGFLGFGAGQFYNRRYLKGAFCAVAELATIFALFSAHSGFNENYKAYQDDAEDLELTEQEVNELWAEAGVYEHRYDFLITYVLPLMHLYGGLDAILDNLNDRRLASGNAKLQYLEPHFEYAYRSPRDGGERVRMGFSLDF